MISIRVLSAALAFATAAPCGAAPIVSHLVQTNHNADPIVQVKKQASAIKAGMSRASTSVLDKAPKLSLDTTADGLDAYVSYFRRLGYTVTLDQELYDRRGKLQIFRFAAHQSIQGSSRKVTATVNVAERNVTASEEEETEYSSKTKA